MIIIKKINKDIIRTQEMKGRETIIKDPIKTPEMIIVEMVNKDLILAQEIEMITRETANTDLITTKEMKGIETIIKDLITTPEMITAEMIKDLATTPEMIIVETVVIKDLLKTQEMKTIESGNKDLDITLEKNIHMRDHIKEQDKKKEDLMNNSLKDLYYRTEKFNSGKIDQSWI